MSRVESAGDAMWCLYVGAQTMQAAQRRGAHWLESSFCETPLQWADVGSLRSCFAQVASHAKSAQQGRRGCKLHVVVSDHWLSAAPVPWSSAHLQPNASVDAARDHLRQWGHELGDADEIRLDDAPAGQPRLALAWPHALLQALDDFAREVGAPSFDVTALSTHLVTRLGREQPSGAVIVLEPGGGLAYRSATFVRREPGTGRIEQVITRNLCFETDAPWQDAERAFQRLAWTVEPDSVAPCLLLDGALGSAALHAAAESVPSGWTVVDWPDIGTRALEAATWVHWLSDITWSPDALTLSRRRTSAGAYTGVWSAAPPRVWHMAAVPVMVALAVAGTWIASGHASRLHQLRAERLARNDAGRGKLPAAAVRPERVAAANLAVQRLNLPLDAVLASVRPPKDLRVALVGLEAAGATQSPSALKITADAATPEEMTRYVAYLAERPPFTLAELVRHEVTAGPNGLVLFRFSVEVAWRQ